MKSLHIALCAIGLIGAPAVGLPQPTGVGASHLRTDAETSEPLEAVKLAAIATRSDRSGRIAAARIGNSDYYVVYIVTAQGCGSGGCRAQIWTVEGGSPVQKGSIAVGRLPIVLLPQNDNGMPRLGVTVVGENHQLAILPVAYDGQNYANNLYDALAAPNSGVPILDQTMLQTF